MGQFNAEVPIFHSIAEFPQYHFFRRITLGHLVSGGFGGQVYVWDLQQGRGRQETERFPPNEAQQVMTVGFAQGIFFGAMRSTWGNGFGIKRVTIMGNGPAWHVDVNVPAIRSPTCAAIDPAASLLAVGGEDRVLRVFDLGVVRTMTMLDPKVRQFPEVQPNASPLPGWIVALAWHPKRPIVAAACANGDTILFQVDNGVHKLATKIEPHKGAVTSLAFTPDGSKLATAGDDGMVRLTDVTSGGVVMEIQASSKAVKSLAFEPHGRLFATGDAEHRVKLWELKNLWLRSELRGHTETVWSVAFSHDGRVLASAGTDLKVRVWNLYPAKGRSP